MLDQFMHLMWERDPDLPGHGSRVASFAGRLGRHLGLGRESLRRLHISAQLHDIGKTRIDAAVVAKPGPLDADEWVEIYRHPLEGFRIVDGLVHPGIAETVLAHHERYDGTGYPFGWAAGEIPILARVLLVADAFDAMTSDRPYQPALPGKQALAELERYAGTQFDPHVVEAMVTVAKTEGWVATPTRELVVAA